MTDLSPITDEETAKVDLSRLRNRTEELVLGCQLAGSRLTTSVDRTLLYRDPSHRSIQAAIDGLVARGEEANFETVGATLAQRRVSHDTMDCLLALPSPFRDLADAEVFDQRFARLIAHLKHLARRQAGRVELVGGDAISPEGIDWLWDGWLARGKLHLLAGSVGAGKTTLALSLAAAITSGTAFPGGIQAGQGNVLFWSGEDDPADSLIPRLVACGGMPESIIFARGVSDADGRLLPFSPARDLAALAREMDAIEKLNLLVIDPIVSAVAGDSDKNGSARRGLAPLVELAAARNIAVLGITHFGKTGQSRDPVNRVLGALSFVAMARLVMVTGKSQDGSRLLVRAKSNIGPDGDGFRYSLAREEIAPGVVGQRIDWSDPVMGTARDLLAESGGTLGADPTKRRAAEDWLREKLKDGSVLARDVESAAHEAGLAWRTVMRAKKNLGVVSTNYGPGWLWQLPAEEDAS